ncbi:MAG: SDR family oxidoreductase [Deltaproteobacteria bacterium]|nr:SDR family oxidoreductase [Deltaproteobacteria bacterium]
MSPTPSHGRGELAGQIAIVTGGGRGIGRAIAQAFATAGAAVVVTARSAEQLATAVTAIREQGGRAIAVPADVTDSSAVQHLVAETERQFGPVDLLVNNAGSANTLGPLWEVDPEDWWHDVTVNLRGTLLCTHAILPGMLARRHGRIINVASLFGIPTGPGTTPPPYASSYSSSKAGVLILTAHLAATTREYGVYVFALGPGFVRTAMTEHVLRSPAGQKWLPEVQAVFDAGRDLPPERAAQHAVFLASGKADGLTGRMVRAAYDLEELVHHIEEVQRDDRYVLRFCE